MNTDSNNDLQDSDIQMQFSDSNLHNSVISGRHGKYRSL